MKGFNEISLTVLDINPTDNCNLSCLSCWKRNPEFKNLDSNHYELSDKKLLEIISESVALGVKEIEITGGGEPLLRKITPLLMKKIKETGIKGSITTNGLLFKEELVKDIVNAGWDRVIFSIDGPNRKVNDYLRGKSFDRIIDNIKLINKYKKQNDKSKPILYFNVVISNKNYYLTDDFIKLAHELNIGYVKFETLTVHSDIGRKLQLNEKQRKKFLENAKKALSLTKKLRVKTNLDIFDEEIIVQPNRMDKLIKKCFEPFYHLVVKTDGSAGPCCLFYGKTPNVKDYSLEEIWNGRYFNNVRKNMSKGKLMDYCRICNIGQLKNNIKVMKEKNERTD